MEEIRSAARWAKECSFVPHLDFIFGFPGEGERERRETLKVHRRSGFSLRGKGSCFSLVLPKVLYRLPLCLIFWLKDWES